MSTSPPPLSEAARALWKSSEVFDLHNDLYVPARLYRFNVHRHHRPGLFGARLTNQTDFPRLRASGLTGLTFDIATNPARLPKNRARVAHRNIKRVIADLAQPNPGLRFVQNHSEYRAARAEGLIGCYLGIQGGQAFQYSTADLAAIPDAVHRITLVHLTNSDIGSTSSPLGRDRGALSPRGVELIEVMDQKRILVDLSHINRAGFMHAIDVHNPTLPLVVTHTGVSGVRKHWRNIDDEQIQRVVHTGGCIGVVLHSVFLAPVSLPTSRCPADAVLDHLEHIIQVGGEHAPAIGTDYDGMIVPPVGLEEVTGLPLLVELMLQRGWPEGRIQNILGLNALRVLEAIRP